MQLLRLRGRKICDYVLRKGNVWKGKHMMIRWLPGPPRHPAVKPDVSGLYVGTLVSAKLDKSAVNRNRMRRRCREAVRLVLKDMQNKSSKVSSADLKSNLEGGEPLRGTAGSTQDRFQLLISPRSSSLKAPFDTLTSDVRAFLSFVSHGRR
jgi:ribonuclease P protein component